MTNGDKASKARSLYDKAKLALREIIDEPDATDEQVEQAQAAFDAALVAFSDVVLGNIAERTMALQSLVEQLDQVIESVQVNPIGGVLDELNSVVSDANELLAEDNSS